MAAVATHTYAEVVHGVRCEQRPPCKLTMSDLLTLGSLAGVVGTTSGGPLTIDLGGRSKILAPVMPPHTASCTQPTVINIRRPGLTISNGCIKLPAGLCLQINTGPGQAAVKLENLTIRGTGVACCDGALLSVVDGSSLHMVDCAVQAGQETGSLCSGIRVSGAGSRAELVQCSISGCGGNGVHVTGQGASVIAENCVAANCSGSGWRASLGASLNLGPGCIARFNKLHGFVAEDEDTVVVASQGCKAQNNQSAGWCCIRGAYMDTGRSSTSTGNVQGFMVVVPGSVLTVGPHSMADSCRAAGYTSGQGGSLVTGDYCTARNCGAGFNGSDRLACLDMGAHCVAEGCTNGIAAGPRAFIDTGPHCRVSGSKIHAVAVSGFDSRITLGKGFRLAGNSKNLFCGRRGFLVTHGLVYEDSSSEEEESGGAAPSPSTPSRDSGTDLTGSTCSGSISSMPVALVTTASDGARATGGGGSFLQGRMDKVEAHAAPAPSNATLNSSSRQSKRMGGTLSSDALAGSQGKGLWVEDTVAALVLPPMSDIAHNLPSAASLGCGFISAPSSPRTSYYGAYEVGASYPLGASAPTGMGFYSGWGSWEVFEGAGSGAVGKGETRIRRGRRQQHKGAALDAHVMEPSSSSLSDGGRASAGRAQDAVQRLAHRHRKQRPLNKTKNEGGGGTR